MKFLQFVVSFCLFASQVISQETLLIELTDERSTISWTPASSENIQVYADSGFQIQIDVVNFDVDGESDNSVTIKENPDDGDVGNEMLLTYVVSGKPRYLYNKNKVQAEYVGSNTSNQVEIRFTRVGELVTTTTIIPTTTEEPMPTPPPDEGSTLTVYLYGRPAGIFGEPEIKALRGAIANMGTEYCNLQNCPLNNTITWRNVQIHMLQQCSVMWEDYDACILLTFALPIVKSKDTKDNPLWDGYQLSESHLKILWESYGSKYLGQIGLSLYAVPDINVIFKYRLIIIAVVIVLVIIIVLSARHVAGKLHKKRRRLSDTVCIMDRTSDRTSQQSLPPHYLQELPPHLADYIGNYPEYNMAFVEDEEKSGPPSNTANQISISNDTNDLEDANA